MTHQVHNHDQSINSANPKLDQLDKLAQDLQHKKSVTTEQAQIEMIDAALAKVEEARKDADVSQKITNNQARLGQYSSVKPAIKTDNPEAVKQVAGVISDNEAQQIIKIKSIPSAVIHAGQKFASLSGKEPSQISHMKTNIKGLFDLVDLKEESALA